MAINIMTINGKTVYDTYEYVCDFETDIKNLPVKGRAGSRAYIVETGNIYILNTQKKWIAINRSSGGGSDSGTGENIPSSGGILIPKTITKNGVYNASSDNADGYNVVTVNVSNENTLDELFADTLEVVNIPSATGIISAFFRDKKSLKNVIMPNVTTISSQAFKGCTNLALTSLPDGVTVIDQTVFEGCTNLALTSLPNGVTSIGSYAFNNCTNLALTSLPNSVTSIGGKAFNNCVGILFLDFSLFNQIPSIQANTFTNTTFPFYFRDQQQIDEWAAATNWSTYADRFQIKPSGVN